MDEFGNLDTADSPEFLANPAQNPMAEYLAQLWRKITPTQRTPGGLLAPSPAPAFGQPNDDDLRMPVPTGALPPAYKPVPRQPVGVFAAAAPPPAPSLGTQPSRDLLIGDDDSSIPRGPTETGMQSGGGVAPTLPKAPEQGMREQFIARMSNLAGRTDPALSPEQKGRALMEAGLAIMAASKPGVPGLAAIGQGGMQGTAVAKEMERINRERSDKGRAEDRADVRTEFELAGRDLDRADRKEEKAEGRTVRREDIARQSERDKATAAYQMRHLDVLEKQFRAGQKKAVEDAATGTYTIMDLNGGPSIKTDVKFNRKDDTPAELKVLRALKADPTLMDTAVKYRGDKSEMADMKDENKRRLAYGQAYLKASTDPTGDISKFPTFEEFSARMGIGGGPPLPAGVPLGSKLIGTKDRFPAYLTPDGRKIVVKP